QGAAGCKFEGPLLLFFNHLADAVKSPVNLLAGNDQRRRDADNAIVRLLAENSLLFQRLAIGPCRAVHLDADPEPSATNFAQVTATQGVQAIEKVSAQFRGALDHLLLDENAQRGTGHGAAQRIAAKGAAVVAGLVNAQNLLGGQHGGDGIEAAGQRLADNE